MKTLTKYIILIALFALVATLGAYAQKTKFSISIKTPQASEFAAMAVPDITNTF